MKRADFIIAVILALCCLGSCRKPATTATLPQLNGSWSLISSVNASTAIATGTGLLAWNAGAGQSVSYSSDHGVTWNVVLSSSSVSSFNYSSAVDAMNSLRVGLYSQSDSTLYISNNGGQTWSVLNHPSNRKPLLCGMSGNRLFAQTDNTSGTVDSGKYTLWKSDDFGNTWDSVASNLWAGFSISGINGSLFAFTQNQIQTLRSTDSGSTWAPWSSYSPFYMGMLSNRVLVGYDPDLVQESMDSGISWNPFFVINNQTIGASGNGNGGVAFDSCALFFANYENASLVCCNPNKLKWYAADKGLSVTGSSSLILDNRYVYALIVNAEVQSTLNVYRRPRSDFAGQ